MSNLSQFFGGGGPSNIIRGSTSFETGPAPGAGNGITVVTINTGVFVTASTTYLTQGCRGDAQTYVTNSSGFGGSGITRGSFTGAGSARINGSGEIVITSGIGAARTVQGGQFGITTTINAIHKGIVDWEAVEFG